MNVPTWGELGQRIHLLVRIWIQELRAWCARELERKADEQEARVYVGTLPVKTPTEPPDPRDLVLRDTGYLRASMRSHTDLAFNVGWSGPTTGSYYNSRPHGWTKIPDQGDILRLPPAGGSSVDRT